MKVYKHLLTSKGGLDNTLEHDALSIETHGGMIEYIVNSSYTAHYRILSKFCLLESGIQYQVRVSPACMEFFFSLSRAGWGSRQQEEKFREKPGCGNAQRPALLSLAKITIIQYRYAKRYYYHDLEKPRKASTAVGSCCGWLSSS